MPNKSILLAGFIVVVFAVGLTELFLLRFESGIDYPEYSSLRSDPRGAMALFESLSSMPGLEVSRNLKPAETLKDSQATIFFLGVKSGRGVEAASKLASGGARVVIGHLHPEKPSEKAERLFTEEKRGKGSIVELRDSFWLSNEALLKKRDPDLISEIVGPARRVVFDESHLGVVETGSMMALARKYGLTGFVFAVLLLLGLFLWKSSSSLLPPMDETVLAGTAVAGRGSHTGFTNLLRRSVPRSTLINVAHEQWRASLAMNRQYPET